MDLFSSAYNILQEFIKNKKRVYFAIDWNKENGTMILTNFGTEEEITEELNWVFLDSIIYNFFSSFILFRINFFIILNLEKIGKVS